MKILVEVIYLIGLVWGHNNTTTCHKCQECSECCSCENPDLIDSDEFITIILS